MPEIAAKKTSDKPRPYGGRSRADRDADRRQRLIDTSLELFGSAGYRRTSMRMLCADAQVSSRHFYQLFPDMEALFRHVYDGIVSDATAAAVRELSDASLTPDERVHAALAAYLHRALDDPNRARVLFLESVGVSEAFEAHRRELIHRLASLVEQERLRLIKEGALPDDGPGYGAVAMVGAVSEVVVDWLHHNCPESPDELVAHISRFFEAVMLGAKARAEIENNRG